jgi:hypothetical protein
MGFLSSLGLRVSPRRMKDPVFGDLLFMYIRKAPEKSYWESEWLFPPSGSVISIGLPGDEHGPYAESRAFFLALPDRFGEIIRLCRPRLEEAWRRFFDSPLPSDIFSVMKLAGFGVDRPKDTPLQWDVSFETTGSKWLGITIPFLGDSPQPAVVDT